MLRRLAVKTWLDLLRRPRSVLIVTSISVLVALWLGSGVELRTSRSELAPHGDPDQLRWEAILGEYRGSEAVIVCIEAADAAARTRGELASFADRLAERAASDPLVERVFWRLDVEWLRDRALYLLPGETLARAADALEREPGFLRAMLEASDLAQFNRLLAGRIERSEASTAASSEAAQTLTGLVALLREQLRFLEDPDSLSARLDPSSLDTLVGRSGDSADGYLSTHDGRTLFLLAIPKSADDSLDASRRIVEALRHHADEALHDLPGFRVSFTGTAAMNVEEMATVRRDTLRTSLVAVAGVGLLTFFVFRWKSHAVLVLASLGAGLAWSVGAVRFELGYLNLITSTFISTLVGDGVAYGIHPVSEYELQGAHTVDPEAAVIESYRRTGAAVLSAGLTTAVAFFSILFMQFRGFGELGLVAGVGVLLCLLSALVFLPALLVVYGRWRGRRAPRARETAALDRLWLERFAGRICSYPQATMLAACAITAAAGVLASGLSFDTNILDLLPEKAESLRYQRKITLESDLSPAFNVVVAEDLGALAALRDRAEREPSIARFESALRFVPEDPEAARRAVRRIGSFVSALSLPPQPRPLDRAELAAALAALESALSHAAEAAFVAGEANLVGPLEQARGLARRGREVVASAGSDLVAGWNEGQRVLHERRREALALVQHLAEMEPPSREDLPQALRERFFTPAGRPLGLLYPAGNVFDEGFLERYVEASRRVSAEAIGFPSMLHKMSGRITTGFYRAVAVGALLVLAILLVDFRNVRLALLAATPLAIGMVWTLGGMRLVGISFNFANLVAVPLIIGVGIDNGVHVIHRVRHEGKEGMDVVLRHTGRAILISSLTTIIGFGSLSLASHRGLASLGIVLMLGIGSCLVASLLVLPNLLVVLGVVKR